MNNYSNHLPLEIDLLFDNKTLNIFQYLCILHYSRIHFNIKKISFEQILFYHTLIYFNENNINFPLINIYLRNKKNLNSMIIYLSNLGFIRTEGNITTPMNKLTVSITESGCNTVVFWESTDLKTHCDNIQSVVCRHPFDKKSPSFNRLLYKGAF